MELGLIVFSYIFGIKEICQWTGEWCHPSWPRCVGTNLFSAELALGGTLKLPVQLGSMNRESRKPLLTWGCGCVTNVVIVFGRVLKQNATLTPACPPRITLWLTETWSVGDHISGGRSSRFFWWSASQILILMIRYLAQSLLTPKECQGQAVSSALENEWIMVYCNSK